MNLHKYTVLIPTYSKRMEGGWEEISKMNLDVEV